ncbi:MAG: CHAD domain-containing protein [Dehalococcoidia bacterium]|nr:CHAD domain-containing protein [Dehalococcoidia bacterium]
MVDAPRDQTEVEWQFAAVDVRPVAHWLESAGVPGYAVASAGTRELRDTYFDTPDWRLHRAGFTCRVRDKGDGLELTLKSMAEAKGAVRTRRELTEPVAAGAPECLHAAPGPCGEIIRAFAGNQRLAPLFTLEQRRDVYRLCDEAGEVAEIALDETAIPLGFGEEPARLVRVEVEVVPGGLGRAERFVEAFVASCGLQPAPVSKFQAALLATGQRPPGPVDLGPDDVHEEMTAGEVAFAVLRRHFAAFLANEAGTRLGEDREALHDMRVAARRMRAALQTFRPYLPARLQAYREELAGVARALGDVRDLDVQLERLSEWRSSVEPEVAEALGPLEAVLLAERDAARSRMFEVLDAGRYERLVERFTEVLRRGVPPAFVPAQQPIPAVAPGLIEKRYQRLRKRGDAIDAQSPASEYHLLRIEAKKLRYALEFVGPIYGKPAVRFSERVTALQDVLGEHQDAHVAVAALEGLARDASDSLGAATLLAMGAVAERYRQRAATLREEFPRAYRPLRGRAWRRLWRVLSARRLLAGPPHPLFGPRMAPQREG